MKKFYGTRCFELRGVKGTVFPEGRGFYSTLTTLTTVSTVSTVRCTLYLGVYFVPGTPLVLTVVQPYLFLQETGYLKTKRDKISSGSKRV